MGIVDLLIVLIMLDLVLQLVVYMVFNMILRDLVVGNGSLLLVNFMIHGVLVVLVRAVLK